MTLFNSSLKFFRGPVTSLAACILLTASLTGCGGSRKVVTGADGYIKQEVPASPKPVQTITISSDVSDPARLLLAEAETWMGTPYLWGGNDRGGVDCSGFVTQVYLRALGIKLPRTSFEQSRWCTATDKRNLQPGDLVFFATTKDSTRVSHVGMYIGDNKMIHSSSSRGVVISGLGEKYYASHYRSAGRVEAYYAMIEKNRKAPDVKLEIARTEKKQPVQEKKKEKKAKAQPKKAVEPAPAPTPIPSPVVTPARATTASASTGDPRADFLNSIVEQKADSIFK